MEVSLELRPMKFGEKVVPLHSLVPSDVSPIVDSFGPQFDSQPIGLLYSGAFLGVLGLTGIVNTP